MPYGEPNSLSKGLKFKEKDSKIKKTKKYQKPGLQNELLVHWNKFIGLSSFQMALEMNILYIKSCSQACVLLQFPAGYQTPPNKSKFPLGIFQLKLHHLFLRELSEAQRACF